MRRLFLLLLLASFSACKEEPKLDAEAVVAKFHAQAAKINSLELVVKRIDTFPGGGVVWNNTGTALIERDDNDPVFGFSYYAKRNNVPAYFLYDQGFAFEIDTDEKQYEVEKGQFGVIGSPGGQMVPPNIFALDTLYKTIELTETESNYILDYTFVDDPNYNITQIRKRVVLDKETFFPVAYQRTSYMLEDRSATYISIIDHYLF